MKKPKVIAIVGPTASGKTSLSIELAKKFAGEVISADSRQVYKGMDIGTAKVTPEEMAGVPHHLLDIVDPITDTYTGADFVRDGNQALTDITKRHKLPIIAGGTFFYLDLLRGIMQSAPVIPNPALRAELEQKSNDALFRLLKEKDPVRAKNIDPDNPRRLIRALEIIDTLGTVPVVTTNESPYDWLILGIDIPIEILNERIERRIVERIKIGMIEEVATLHTAGVSWEKLNSFGLEYRYIAYYLQNLITKDEMITELTSKIRQFAKRQRTWLRRDHTIQWLSFPVDIDNAKDIVFQHLQQ